MSTFRIIGMNIDTKDLTSVRIRWVEPQRWWWKVLKYKYEWPGESPKEVAKSDPRDCRVWGMSSLSWTERILCYHLQFHWKKSYWMRVFRLQMEFNLTFMGRQYAQWFWVTNATLPIVYCGNIYWAFIMYKTVLLDAEWWPLLSGSLQSSPRIRQNISRQKSEYTSVFTNCNERKE